MARTLSRQKSTRTSRLQCSGNRGVAREALSFFVRGARTACGAKRPQTLIAERQDFQKQRGSPQSASTIFHGLARPVFRRPANKAGYVTHPWNVRPPVASHVRARAGTRVRRSTSSRSSPQTWSGLGIRYCNSKSTRNPPSWH